MDWMYSRRVTNTDFTRSVLHYKPPPHESCNRPSEGGDTLCHMSTERGTIAARLSALRADKGWKLREASDATEGLLSPSRISNYEQGLREMGIPEAKILAKAYGTTAAHLLCLDDDNPVLSPAERDLIRNLRALPENERHGYMRRIAAVALAYKEPVADERIPEAFNGAAKMPQRTKPAKRTAKK